jgi:hypothetical protein
VGRISEIPPESSPLSAPAQSEKFLITGVSSKRDARYQLEVRAANVAVELVGAFVARGGP